MAELVPPSAGNYLMFFLFVFFTSQRQVIEWAQRSMVCGSKGLLAYCIIQGNSDRLDRPPGQRSKQFTTKGINALSTEIKFKFNNTGRQIHLLKSLFAYCVFVSFGQWVVIVHWWTESLHEPASLRNPARAKPRYYHKCVINMLWISHVWLSLCRQYHTTTTSGSSVSKFPILFGWPAAVTAPSVANTLHFL